MSVRASSVVGGSGVTSKATAAFAVVTGDTVSVWFNYGSSSNPTSVTDTIGNTYTQRAKVTRAGSFTSFRYDCVSVGSNASNVVTLNIGFSEYPTLAAASLGSLVASPLDVEVTLNSDTTQPWQLATGTLAQADEDVFAWIGADSGSPGQPFVETSGMTILGQIPDSANYWPGALAHRAVLSTSSYTPGFTNAAGGSNSVLITTTFKRASGGGGDVTLGITGVEGTGAVGSVGEEVSYGLTGVAAAGDVGSVVANVDRALTGVAGTGAVGTITRSISQGLTGVAGTGAAGSVAPAIDYALSGVEGTGAAGDVTVQTGGDVTLGITGVEGTGEAGSVVAGIDTAISGNTATGAVGSVAPGVSYALSGVAGAGGVGTVTPSVSGDVTIAITGVQGVGEVGNVTVSGGDPVVDVRGGTEFGGQHFRHFKPLLRRILDSKAPRVKPAKERAQKRAKAIEKEAVALVLDDGTEEDLQALFDQWIAEHPIMPADAFRLDPMAVFMAQLAMRMRQQQLEQEALARLAAEDALNEENAILALLLA